MRRTRRAFAWAGLAALVCLAILLAGTRWGDRSLYPAAPGAPSIPVYLVSNGFHSGLVLPRAALSEVAGDTGQGAVLAVAIRFGHYDWIETGWGDDRFYREVPTVSAFNWHLGLRALFWPGNLTVMHVVGIEGDPHPVFGGSDLVRLDLTPDGFGRLVAALDRSFARDPAGLPLDLGPGLYGPSLFYRAVGMFGWFNVCNHWTARMLDAAGVPVSPVAATLPMGLVADLRLRSGLTIEPHTLSATARTN